MSLPYNLYVYPLFTEHPTQQGSQQQFQQQQPIADNMPLPPNLVQGPLPPNGPFGFQNQPYFPLNQFNQYPQEWEDQQGFYQQQQQQPQLIQPPIQQLIPSYQQSNKTEDVFADHYTTNNQYAPSYSQYQRHSSIYNRPNFSNTSKFKSEPTIPQSMYVDNYFAPPQFSSSVGHFKPIQTKKNSRPRINKLYKAKSRKKPTTSDNFTGELSIEELVKNFSTATKIDLNSRVYEFQSVLEVDLFNLFVDNISAKVDIFLPQAIFQKVLPILALHDTSGVLLNAIFVLSSLVYQRNQPIDPTIPLKYYQDTIQLINRHLNGPETLAICFLGTTLLCIYELFFIAVEGVHLASAFKILSTLQSKGIKSFGWILFIIDTISSIRYSSANYCSLAGWRQVDIEQCKRLQLFPSPMTNTNKEYTLWWFNKSLINMSLVNDLVNTQTAISLPDHETQKHVQDWIELKRTVHEFELNMPVGLKPLVYKQEKPFPRIYFKDELTALTAINFKLAKIGLYEAYLKLGVIVDEIEHINPVKLTIDIIGILRVYENSFDFWLFNVHMWRRLLKYFVGDAVMFNECKVYFEKIVRVYNLA